MTIFFNNSSLSGKVPLPADLQFGELALNSADGKAYMKLSDNSVREAATTGTLAWVRNPTWLPMPATTSAQEQVDLLIAVYPESAYMALNITCIGGYTVDWGDGTAPQNIASATQVDYLYNFGAAGLSTTDQIYKNALIKITPTVGGNTFTSINLGVKNSTSNLQSYAQPILDATISAACTSLIINGTVSSQIMERCTILRTNLTSMSALFQTCFSLQSVSLAGTSLVTTTANMFQNCGSLRSLPLFDTSAVTDMSWMFASCFSLQLVPLFNTINVTNMALMFNGCSSLQTVPLFNTVNVTNVTSMFQNCRSLQVVPLFNTTNVISMGVMFGNCGALQSVPLFDTSNVTTISSMFSNCSSLLTVPLLNIIKATSVSGMFSNCTSLQTVPLLNTVAATSMSSMFQNCSSLQIIPAFDTTSMTGSSGFATMFSNCSNLQQVPNINFNKVGITSGGYNFMFNGCTSLSKIGTGAANTGPNLSFDVLNCKLSATALNALYTSLPTVVGQTITVTGNVGVTGHNPSIATAKGWTVVSS